MTNRVRIIQQLIHEDINVTKDIECPNPKKQESNICPIALNKSCSKCINEWLDEESEEE